MHCHTPILQSQQCAVNTAMQPKLPTPATQSSPTPCTYTMPNHRDAARAAAAAIAGPAARPRPADVCVPPWPPLLEHFAELHRSATIFCTAIASLNATVLLHAEDSNASTSATTIRFSMRLLFQGVLPTPRVAQASVTHSPCAAHFSAQNSDTRLSRLGSFHVLLSSNMRCGRAPSHQAPMSLDRLAFGTKQALGFDWQTVGNRSAAALGLLGCSSCCQLHAVKRMPSSFDSNGTQVGALSSIADATCLQNAGSLLGGVLRRLLLLLLLLFCAKLDAARNVAVSARLLVLLVVGLGCAV